MKTSGINSTVVRIVPFTGPVFAIYAFFWPVSFGTWFGSIVHAFRAAAGI